MKKSEATQHKAVAAWIREFLKKTHALAVEIKHTRGSNSLPFSAVEEHQEAALLAVSSTGIVFKIPDGSFQRLPFDMFGMAASRAFVAIRYSTVIAIIDIKVWCKEKKISKRKSLTSERAQQIAHDVILIS